MFSVTSKSLSGHTDTCQSVSWCEDGSMLATGGLDRTVRIYNTEGIKCMDLKGHKGSVTQLHWHPNDRQVLMSTGQDRMVMIWDSRKSKPTNIINTKGHNINCDWSNDSHYIAVGDKLDVIRVIDTRTWNIVYTHTFPTQVNEFSFSYDNNYFITSSSNGAIGINSFPDFKSITSTYAHSGSIYVLKQDPTGTYFATGGADALVCLFNTSDLACIQTIDRLETPVRSVSFSYDGEFLASASEDTGVDVASVKDGTCVTTLLSPGPTTSVSFNPKRMMLALSATDNKNDKESPVLLYSLELLR